MIMTVVLFIGCERQSNTLEPPKYPTTPEVFLDDFSAGLDYAAFGNSKVDAFDIELRDTYKGPRAMRIAVPNAQDPEGAFAGGAFFTSVGRDLSGYDALTFYAKASKAASLDVVGFGNDLSGASRFVAEINGFVLNTNWRKYTIPIPLSEKLSAERGMFYFSEGPEDGFGYTIWFDEVQFERLGTINQPRPVILAGQDQNFSGKVGETFNLAGTSVTFNMSNGLDQIVQAARGYFTFTSSDVSVATVDENGVVTAVGLGTSTITAKLGSVDAKGSFTLTVEEAPPAPTEAAPAPTVPPGNVISLFSNSYSNVTVDTWRTDWSDAEFEDVQINGDDTKLYTRLNFAGIEFLSQEINATAMTHFHMDIWTPDPSAAPAAFKIKLVNDVNGSLSEDELSFTDASTPPLATGSWVSFDIPLSDFAALAARDKLGQLIISGDPNTVYVDNVFFYTTGGSGNEPTVAAPTPTQPAGTVISLFSDAYDNQPVDTWSAEWDNADVADVLVAGDSTKLYTNLTFAGIEFLSQEVDASAMTHFHMDIWTADPTSAPAVFKIKLVNDVLGSLSEHELTFNDASSPPLVTGNWISFDIPLTDFTGLASTDKLGQLIISGDPNTVYVDNIYFHSGGGGGGSEPSTAAPTPGYPAGDVISLFSDPYDNVLVDTWSAEWDNADVQDVLVAGDSTKLYTNLTFAGIEFLAQEIDASEMTHFRMDIWTPDPSAAPAVFKIKLVNDVFGSLSEHELVFDAASTPPLVTGNWITYDIPLTDFTGLAAKDKMGQLIISGDPNTVYVDNILFHK
jgi:hypothetical protein